MLMTQSGNLAENPAIPPDIRAEIMRRLARQRYSSGLIDFRDVLDTQRTLLSTQDSVASTRASLSADHVRLYKALGGGWTPEAPGAGAAQSFVFAPSQP